MKAVILAAGKGTRMGALTADTPKPMLQVHGTPVLSHILDALPREIDEVVLVVGYLKEKIRDYVGREYAGRNITYVQQHELNGTAGALWCAKEFLHDRFLVMNGDDICRAEDMQACASSPDWAMLVQQVEEIGSAGKVVLNEQGLVSDILEKEVHGGGPGIANTANFFLLDERFFDYPPVLRPGSDTEFGLPQTVVTAAADIPIHPIPAGIIIRLTDPSDIGLAEAQLSPGSPHP
jgi:NDP-sugar pyrophosphorylase family protein